MKKTARATIQSAAMRGGGARRVPWADGDGRLSGDGLPRLSVSISLQGFNPEPDAGAPAPEPRRVEHGGFGAAAPLQPRGTSVSPWGPWQGSAGSDSPTEVTRGGDTPAAPASPRVWGSCSSPHQQMCTSGIMWVARGLVLRELLCLGSGQNLIF